MTALSIEEFDAKYTAVYTTLAQTYGEPVWQPHNPPVDELVCTILSQATSDSNRDKGFYALKVRYPDWECVMKAPPADVIQTIYSAGLANQKGPRIQSALRFIHEERGVIDLDFLNDLSLDDAQKWLMQIKGIGPKTAAIILLFSFGRPSFPVDTHVYRITRRLGLIDHKVTADKAHNILQNRGDAKNLLSYAHQSHPARPYHLPCPKPKM
ncbi:MAG: endonuclease III [Anaerolineae bacterium]|nr:endonuclease III [Anaerolineae bacterium]